MKSYYIAFIVFAVISCGQVQEKPKYEQTVSHKPIESMSDYSPSFEKAHPKAKELMTDEFYFSPIEETAQFGNDDGADTYAGFKDWRRSLLPVLLSLWDETYKSRREEQLKKMAAVLNKVN